MATRLARQLQSSFSAFSSSPITKLTSDISHPSMSHGGPGLRCASSSSSSSSSTTATGSNSSSSKREKKITDRLSAVIDAVNDRKLPPELRGQRNNVRSETDIINVVEQRIWHSMEEGQFENLAGKGKPLNLNTNPHADPAEDTLYRILSKNGCAPEWVELNKEIRTEVSEWRVALKKAWTSKCNGNDEEKWIECCESLKKQLRDINDKVFRYNLIVPFGRQMFGLKWEKEVAPLEE
ncbi:dnaJ-like protein subfamily C member 28-like [Gossypium australe]|uniref:DnaJ-like protein subfamily C member 28-like n=1 Tax=Gossypium australe TaxID=47621 RepID=A0A5B6V464_9ROSI|nr:dnaJ-like protein subfamily C member 28-like [Gossypium australe]